MAQPSIAPFVAAPPPWERQPGYDYRVLLLPNLKYDVPKTAIRAIFQENGCEFGGQGCL